MDGIIKKAVLVNITPEKDADKPLEELEKLAETAGYEVVALLTQHKTIPDRAYYIGTGKLEELKNVASATECDVIIFDNELSGIQYHNLEKCTGVTVMDRADLIIEIFSLHAASNEGKLQVELMEKRKLLPRILGQGLVLSRQGGGGAGGGGARRGGGEQQKEIDKRTLKEEIRALEERLEKLDAERKLRRDKRIKNRVKTVSVVGYTNAGKSTLMNALTGAGVLEENKLFATLDPVSRRLWLGEGREVLFTDTVGFISRLPHGFVKAFRSTLQETACADLIIHLSDVSSPDAAEQYKVVTEVLGSLDVGGTPIIVALNKCDLAEPSFIPEGLPYVKISARTGAGINELKEKISEILFG